MTCPTCEDGRLPVPNGICPVVGCEFNLPPCPDCGTLETEWRMGWHGFMDWYCFDCDQHFYLPAKPPSIDKPPFDADELSR